MLCGSSGGRAGATVAAAAAGVLALAGCGQHRYVASPDDVRAALAAPRDVEEGWTAPIPALRDDGAAVRIRLHPDRSVLTTWKEVSSPWSAGASGRGPKLRLKLLEDERYRDHVESVSFLGPEGRWLYTAGGIAAGASVPALLAGLAGVVLVGILARDLGITGFERTVLFVEAGIPFGFGLAALVTGGILAFIGHAKMRRSEEVLAAGAAPPGRAGARPEPADEDAAEALEGEE